MSIWPSFARRVAGSLFLMALVACGGGAGGKREPMVADSTASAEVEEPVADVSTSESKGDTERGERGEARVTDASDKPESVAILQGNEDGARALLQQFVAPNADHLALTRSLRPTSSDYKTLFDAKTAAKVEAAQAKDWDSNKAVIKPKPGQTEIKVWAATGSDIAKGTGNAREFPAGYKKVAKHLSPTVLFFRFKFVEPGKDVGTAYDGLAFINGHWVIAPKPWRALEGKTGGMEDEAERAEKPSVEKPEAKGPKKKPKGGKRKK